MDRVDPQDIIVELSHPFGTARVTLAEWMVRGPGPRPFVRPEGAVHRLTGERLPLSVIPRRYRNDRVTWRMILSGDLKRPDWPGFDPAEILAQHATRRPVVETDEDRPRPGAAGLPGFLAAMRAHGPAAGAVVAVFVGGLLDLAELAAFGCAGQERAGEEIAEASAALADSVVAHAPAGAIVGRLSRIGYALLASGTDREGGERIAEAIRAAAPITASVVVGVAAVADGAAEIGVALGKAVRDAQNDMMFGSLPARCFRLRVFDGDSPAPL